MFDRPEILNNLNFVYESRHCLALHEYLQRGQQQFFIIVIFSIRYQTLTSDIDTFFFNLALFIVSLDLKSVYESFVYESRSSLARYEYLLQCQTIRGHSSHALTVEL